MLTIFSASNQPLPNGGVARVTPGRRIVGVSRNEGKACQPCS
jgi:hypothetical protein